MQASLRGHSSIVAFLVAKPSIDLTLTNKKGELAYQVACGARFDCQQKNFLQHHIQAIFRARLESLDMAGFFGSEQIVFPAA